MAVNRTISVIIPTFNRRDLVLRAIKSVIAQSFKKWEAIVVDDGSQDETKEAIVAIGDPRIKYIFNNGKHGAARARNLGLAASRCEYIAFLDSDDELMPESLAKRSEVLKTKNADLVYSGAIFIDESGRQRIKKTTVEGMVYRQELEYNPIGGPSRVMLKRKCIDDAGKFDENMVCHEDWDLWIRISKTHKVVAVNLPLTKYYELSQSVSSDSQLIIAGAEQIWQKHGISELGGEIMAIHHFRLGHQLCDHGDTANGRKYFIKSLWLRPFNLKFALLYALSFLGSARYHFLTFRMQGLLANLGKTI